MSSTFFFTLHSPGNRAANIERLWPLSALGIQSVGLSHRADSGIFKTNLDTVSIKQRLGNFRARVINVEDGTSFQTGTLSQDVAKPSEIDALLARYQSMARGKLSITELEIEDLRSFIVKQFGEDAFEITLRNIPGRDTPE